MSHTNELIQEVLERVKISESKMKFKMFVYDKIIKLLRPFKYFGISYVVKRFIENTLKLHIIKSPASQNIMDDSDDCEFIHPVPQGYFASKKEFRQWIIQPFRKFHASEILIKILDDPYRFDGIYSMLEDEYSRKTFDWLIKYSIAYAVRSKKIAYDFFTPPMITKDGYKKFESSLKRTEDGLLQIDGFQIDVDSFSLINTFVLEQYRYKKIVEPVQDDIVVDVGAFVGDTALWFSKFVGKDGKVYAFEPFSDNYKILIGNIKRNHAKGIVIPVKKALGSKKMFVSTKFTDASVAISNFPGNVEMTTLDDFLIENDIRQINFIKADIEGFEMNFLKGAENTIKTYKPKIAICVYHKADDILEIPYYLRNLVPDYKFYLKHHTTSFTETVLYASL